MPKITDIAAYPPVTEVKEGDKLLGVQEGEVRQFPANLVVREQWDDITKLLTPTSEEDHYELSNASLPELIKNIPLRITIEASMILGAENIIAGTIQLYVTVTGIVVPVFLLTNTLYNSDNQSFTGHLLIQTSPSLITYNYGATITTVTRRPKILKIERLVE